MRLCQASFFSKRLQAEREVVHPGRAGPGLVHQRENDVRLAYARGQPDFLAENVVKLASGPALRVGPLPFLVALRAPLVPHLFTSNDLGVDQRSHVVPPPSGSWVAERLPQL